MTGDRCPVRHGAALSQPDGDLRPRRSTDDPREQFQAAPPSPGQPAVRPARSRSRLRYGDPGDRRQAGSAGGGGRGPRRRSRDSRTRSGQVRGCAGRDPIRRGLSTDVPYEDGSFDVVLATLFLHHLTGEDKRRTAREIARVLKPGGELHVAAWGRPSDPLMALLFWQIRVFDGLEQTRENGAGALPAIFEEGGLEDAAETDRLRTVFGTLALYRARAARVSHGDG